MWLSFTTFFGSLLALVILFIFKGIEQRGRFTTPLSHLRKVGDSLVADGFVRYAQTMHRTGKEACTTTVLWCRDTFHRVETFSVSRVSTLASRLHLHLMRRERSLSNDSKKVSAHLKDMAEERKDVKESATDIQEEESISSIE